MAETVEPRRYNLWWTSPIQIASFEALNKAFGMNDYMSQAFAETS